MKNIHIYLCRHGESEANANGLEQIGQDNNTPLTEKGMEQAKKLGERFIDLKAKGVPEFIASSSYKRALDTANIALKQATWDKACKINITDALVEYNPGDWKGKNRSIIYEDIKNLKAITYQHMGFLFPNGESYAQVERRASVYLEDAVIYNKTLLKLAEKQEVNVVLFSHGMTIKCLLHRIMGFDQSFLWKIHIDNTSVSHIVYNDKGFFLNSINDISHLK
jgi:alpha-ribazole phosphatase